MAKKHLIVHFAAATKHPVHDVVCVAPGCRSVAARPPAVPVAGDKSPPAWAFDRPLGAADVDHH